jgi:hypothetical protein
MENDVEFRYGFKRFLELEHKLLKAGQAGVNDLFAVALYA